MNAIVWIRCGSEKLPLLAPDEGAIISAAMQLVRTRGERVDVARRFDGAPYLALVPHPDGIRVLSLSARGVAS